MAQYYIVNLEDGVTTKTDDAVVAKYYEDNDEFVVIDVNRDVTTYYGEDSPIGDATYDPDEPGEPDPEEEGVED